MNLNCLIKESQTSKNTLKNQLRTKNRSKNIQLTFSPSSYLFEIIHLIWNSDFTLKTASNVKSTKKQRQKQKKKCIIITVHCIILSLFNISSEKKKRWKKNLDKKWKMRLQNIFKGTEGKKRMSTEADKIFRSYVNTNN